MSWLAPCLIFILLAAPALRLARMPGKAERSVAAFFLASAAGLSLRLAAVADGITDSPIEYILNALGHVGLSIACIALFVFTRSVFHPTERWARRLHVFGVAAAIGSLAGLLLDGGVASEQATSVLVANGVRTASFSWCFVESLLYWQMMRRRVALGLAEPIVANRFGLWCVWTGGLMSCLGLVLLTRIVGLTMGLGVEALPHILRVVRIVLLSGVVTTMIAIWLSFFPPARYIDWIERRGIA